MFQNAMFDDFIDETEFRRPDQNSSESKRLLDTIMDSNFGSHKYVTDSTHYLNSLIRTVHTESHRR